MFGFSFLHPWLLAGLLAAAIPVILHWVGRHRAQRIHFSAFEFLISVNKQVAFRERLRQILLLLLRTLAVISLVLALSRPQLTQNNQASPLTQTDSRLVIILDSSRSMNFTLQQKTLLRRGITSAKDLLSQLAPGDSAGLLVTSSPTSVHLSADFNTIKAALELLDRQSNSEKIISKQGDTDFGAAIEQAITMFGKIKRGDQIIIISDLSANGFADIPPMAIHPAPTVRLIDIALKARKETHAPLKNMAITEVKVSAGNTPLEKQFMVTVRNFSDQKVMRQPLSLQYDGQERLQVLVSIAPLSSVKKTLTYRFKQGGQHHGEIRLQADSYPYDDSYPFVVEIGKRVKVLAVNGDPRATPYEDELFFLERALENTPMLQAPIAVTATTIDSLNSDMMKQFDILILSNVGDIYPPQVDLLEQFVNTGGGLLITLGENIASEHLNQVMGNLLPRALRSLHRAEDKDAGTLALGITNINSKHPIFRQLGTRFTQSLERSQTASYFNVATDDKNQSNTLLRYSNGAPALLERISDTAEQGRVLLLSTSIDLDHSNIAISAAFPALMQRVVRYLAHQPPGNNIAQEVRAGLPLTIQMTAGVINALRYHTPSGHIKQLVLDADSGDIVLGPFEELGAYTIDLYRAHWEPAPELNFTVLANLSESNFTPYNEKKLQHDLGNENGASRATITHKGQQVSDSIQNLFNPFGDYGQRGYAALFLLLLVLCFAGEGLLAARG